MSTVNDLCMPLRKRNKRENQGLFRYIHLVFSLLIKKMPLVFTVFLGYKDLYIKQRK